MLDPDYLKVAFIFNFLVYLVVDESWTIFTGKFFEAQPIPD